jgi:hypothetical protein
MSQSLFEIKIAMININYNRTKLGRKSGKVYLHVILVSINRTIYYASSK